MQIKLTLFLPSAFNLINKVNIPETEAHIDAYRKENAALIELNVRQDEQYAQDLRDQEDQDRIEWGHRAHEARREQ